MAALAVLQSSGPLGSGAHRGHQTKHTRQGPVYGSASVSVTVTGTDTVPQNGRCWWADLPLASAKSDMIGWSY